MANQTAKRCAHMPCLCEAPPGEEYCGNMCREAGNDNVAIACQCAHRTCPLTIREFLALQCR
jgi:hypothetical protein